MLLSTILWAMIVGVLGVERPLVTTSLGDIRGTWRTSAKGKQYAAFTRVPYAKPPVGELRFEPPEEVERWIGVWDAVLEPPTCISFVHRLDRSQTEDVVGVEDCLYLNVFTPKLTTQGKKLPVIVYIHGGAFMFGSSSWYGEKYFMDKEVVFVTLNYRLGPLGFLSLDDPIQPGNNGLKDQVAALKWVQKHISAFSGDPNNVAITGESAGGASVHYHFLSPMSRGLFVRGISSSASTLCRWTLTDKAREKGMQLAASVGCPTDKGARQVIECLKQRPAEMFLERVGQFQVWQYSPYTPFGPVVEKVQGAAPTFLPDWPVRLLQRGDFKRVPWMTGVTTAEGLYPVGSFIADEDELSLLDRDLTRLLPHLLDFNLTLPQSKHEEVSAAIKKHYLGDQPISKDTVTQFIKMVSDRLFVADIQRTAEVQSKFSPVYFYEFGYRGKHSMSELLSDTDIDFGVSHADDLGYVMNVTFIIDETFEEENEVRKMWLDAWTTFAKTGVPDIGDVEWTPVKPGGELEYLYVGGMPPSMRSAADLGDAKFWDSLPLNEPEQTVDFTKDEL